MVQVHPMESFKATPIGWPGTIAVLLVLFLPTIMAWSRRRRQAPAITVCNLAIGVAQALISHLPRTGALPVLILSLVGWIVALIWSLIGDGRNRDPLG